MNGKNLPAERAGAASPRKASGSTRRQRARSTLGRPVVRWTLITGAGAAAVTAVALLTVRLMPTPKPDIWGDATPEVANYLFEPEFSELPTEERLNYLVEFARRFKEFDQDDAAMLSTFLADVNRQMREQVEENMRRLAMDLMSENAAAYAELSPTDRAAFLEQFSMDLEKLGEDMFDERRDETDAERIERLKRQAKRDRERVQERADRPQADRVGRFFAFYEEASAESGLSPVQKGQVARLMLDMTRHLRGEKLNGDN